MTGSMKGVMSLKKPQTTHGTAGGGIGQFIFLFLSLLFLVSLYFTYNTRGWERGVDKAKVKAR